MNQQQSWHSASYKWKPNHFYTARCTNELNNHKPISQNRTIQNSVLISHFTHNFTLPKTQYTASHQTHQSQHKRINPTANEDRNGARYHGVGLGRRCAGGNWGPSRFGGGSGRCSWIVFDGDVKLHPTKAIQVVATDEVPVPWRGQGKRWVPSATGLQYSVGRVARLVTLFRYLAHAVGRRVLEHCMQHNRMMKSVLRSMFCLLPRNQNAIFLPSHINVNHDYTTRSLLQEKEIQ